LKDITIENRKVKQDYIAKIIYSGKNYFGGSSTKGMHSNTDWFPTCLLEADSVRYPNFFVTLHIIA
jgi:hypothetical protein